MNANSGDPSIETLLTIGENIVIEFKRAGDGPKHDTYESICAFLNRNGGDVLLGVTDYGEVVGIPPKSAKDMVRSIVKVMNDPNLWEPRIAVYPEIVEREPCRGLHSRLHSRLISAGLRCKLPN